MGLKDFFSRNSVLDFVKWDGDIGVLAYRHPKCNIGKFTKLQVTEAQEAVVIVNGKRSQKFDAGTHTLDSPNIPILKEFFGIPYGGENPWTVQAWFVNKLTPMNIDWTIDSFLVYDEGFQVNIPVIAKGKYGITIDDAEKFILNLALGYPETSQGVPVHANHFTDQLTGEFNINAKSIITKVMASNKISINAINAHLADFSNHLESQINPFFLRFGCKLLNLYVTNIEIDQSTEVGRRITQAIADQASQKISGHTWQQGKMFETVDKAFDGLSNGNGGILGAVMAMNMMGGGNVLGGSGLMNPQYSQPEVGAPASGSSSVQPKEFKSSAIKDVYCSNCSKKFTSDKQFCPYCGDKYAPCPKCGSDNDVNAVRCVNCGHSLSSQNIMTCAGCGNVINSDSGFCSHCGRPCINDNSCPRCGSNVGANTFCSSCGFKVR